MAALGLQGIHERFKTALAVHDDEASPYVAIDLPIQTLADVERCRQTTKILGQFAGSWERHQATARLWEMLPNSPGLYMFVWVPALQFSVTAGARTVSHGPYYVLYVGEAGGGASFNTLRDRYRGEYADYIGGDPEQLWEVREIKPRRQELLRRYLTLVPMEYWCVEIPERRDLIRKLERRLISLINPPLVAQHRTKLVGPPRPAF